jgi:mercuric ion transport protein
MRNSTLIATGAIGAVLAAICCAPPLFVVVLGTVGLGGWLAKAGYVVNPTFVRFHSLRSLDHRVSRRMWSAKEFGR